MELKSLISFYIVLYLVNLIAGNDVILFNADKELSQEEEDIDSLLQGEQLFQYNVNHAKKTQTDRPERVKQTFRTTKLPKHNITTPAASTSTTASTSTRSTTRKPGNGQQLSHNCTHSNKAKRTPVKSSARLKWQSLDTGPELEEDDLLENMDYQYLVLSEESMFHRARRQALEQISGYSTYRSKFTLGNREITSTESQDGTGEFLRLRSSTDDYISSTLQKAFPNRPIIIGITKLSSPHTTVEFDIQIHDDLDLNDTRKQLAKALDAIDKADNFQLDSKTYSVEEVMLGKDGGDDSTLEYTICILCSDYQTCTQTNGVWTCQLSDPRLYSFGSVQQDSSMVKNVDYATVQLKVPDAITWGEEEVSNIWISVNGFISLGSEFVSYIPRRLPMNSRKLLAVYWSDLELRPGDVGEVYYQIYSKYGRKYDPVIFKKANEDVKSYTGDGSYDATSVIVVTWSDMAPYPLYRSEMERVTFQCTIITDGTTTYAVYHYGHGAMRFNSQLRRPVEAGWGDINLDSSRMNYYNFDRNLGNTGVVGKWFFKIGRRENYQAKCLNWYYKNLQDYDSIRFWDIVLPKCPCNEFFVWATGWWQMSNQNGVSCYESYNSYTPYGRVCCYRLDDWQLSWSSLIWMFSAFGRTFGTFENRMPFAGSLQRNSPYFRGNYNYGYFNNPMFDTSRFSTQTIFAYMHEVDDLEPKQWCCYQSNLCHLYYQVRPASNCIGPSVNFGIGFGDPQITTLDNKWFIFNGLGEYRLLEITGKHPKNASLSVDFKLQGRTCKAVTSSGVPTNATVWCALALKTTSGNTSKIEVSETGNYMIIYANGQDYSLRFRYSQNFSEVNKDIYLRKDSITESLMISTADGVGLTVSLKSQILVYTLDVDEMYKSMTRGLLSNFNDDPTDDFIFPNSTKLSNSASDRQIFDYGQAWGVSQDSSLFDYIYGQNPSDPKFMPLFLDQLNTTEAAIVCNDTTHIACLYDYAVTRNPGIALLTKKTVDVFANTVKLVGNSAPTITGNQDYNVTINQTLNIVLNCTDPDKDNLSVVVLSKPNQGFIYSLTDGQLSISYTPSKITDESIELVVHDSAGLDSGVLKLNLTVCSGCSNHGHCDFADLLAVNTPYKAVARCVCDVGYAGDDCEFDRDGCLMEPCPDQTKCQDLDVATERATGLSFKCADCPKGYKLVNNDTKCEDIDECQTASNACPAHAICQNTIGSFECNCGHGFRKYNGQCIDINECAEYQDDCAQICINELSTFTCDCYEGYRKYGIISHDCVQREDVCKGLNLTCEYGCTNQSGVAECFCQRGKKLADDKQSCIDIDECQLNLCPQGCQNINGGFICTCFDGFHLSDADNLTCEACPDDKYGPDCKKLCYCRGRAMDCDAVRGCVECDSGWTGDTCSQDVDECAASATTCPQDQICTNTNGSYICSCPTGYELINGGCENIDECVSIQTSLCSQVCVDTPGSFSCQCKDGFKSSTNGTCIDIDECSYSTSGCQHKCTNVESSHNCECFPGYRLLEDRRTCQEVVSPCQNLNISCSFGCTLINSVAQCFCPLGYILGSDNYTCYDIDECTVQGDHQDKCTDNCFNTPGSYNCSCPIGKALLPDQRTCEVCDAYHWGEDCSQDCACYPIGSDKCDPVVGCICKTGWAGVNCKTDVDECQSSKLECIAPSICVNLPGSYKCQCPDGFQNVNNTCVDINECADTKTCDHNCTNTIGSFHCTCFEGFKVDGAKCLDIDECAVPSLSKCDQLCRNTPGGFACECLDGYSLNMTTRTTCGLLETAKACNSSSLCNQICTVVDGKDVCSCHPGYKLNSSNITCIDINECSGSNPCSSGQCNNIDGSFFCTCPAGYKLTSDQLTCQECEEGYYGINCSSSCTCTSTNTVSCNTTNGSCVCKPGWQGQTCSVDIDECSTNGVCYNNSQCINSLGSYKCVCATGYFSNGSSCSACDVNRYGQDCAQTCTCNFANTLDCNHTTGQCHCKPGWEGVNCDQDINECANPSYCSGNFVQCINLNGSADCRCLSGYERPTNSSTCQDINECENSLLNNCLTPSVCNNTLGSYECVCMKGFHNVSGQCSACDSLHYGTNCAMDCQCHVNNTLDCDDINGTCTCRLGWTGQKCDLDVDECTQNASFCSGINETCSNLNGSAECLCKIGLYKAAFNESCRACGSLFYGLNCASQCSCNVTNTEDCNDVNGTCSCKPGWTGPTCNQACNATQYGPNCASKCSCNVTNTEDCNDVNGTCSCKPGWTGAICNQGCDSTHFGPNCGTLCTCAMSNTLDCNDVNGACTCKTGWTGSDCSQDVNECNINNYCPGIYETCNNLVGSAECVCRLGFYRPIVGARCQACDSTHFGRNCSSLCTCSTTNTADCDDQSGACTCLSGWTGSTCTQQDTCSFASSCLTDFYQFGPSQGDSTMVKSSELATSRLYIPNGMSWGQELVSYISVTVNGLLSFDEDFNTYVPQRLPISSYYNIRKVLAVYWSDLDIYNGDVGEVYYQMYSKYGYYNWRIFTKANSDVARYGWDYSFDATTVIVVTWFNVIPYPSLGNQYERVTFQCTIITDGFATYIVYNYGQGGMRFNSYLQRPVEVGWGHTNLDISRLNYYSFDQVVGNTGSRGKWFFKVGQRENYRMKCFNWYQRNLRSLNDINLWDNVIPKCPCSEYFAQVNGWWFTALEYNDFCYQSYIPYYRGGRKCCYRRDGWLLNWWQMSTFYILLGIHETRMPLAGSLQLYSPYYSSYYGSYWYYNNFYNSYYGNVPIYGSYWYFGDPNQIVNHQQEDLDPKTWCCDLSDQCYLYYQVRPLSYCVGSTFYYGYFFGDPHIMTLDERSFIFNGLGEYRIVEISGQMPEGNTSLSIKLQGRTCRATNSQGNLTDATVWCALVLQTNNNSTLRINLADSKDSLIIYANKQDYTLRFNQNENFIAVDNDITLRRDNESLRVTTLDEFGITVSITNQFMQFTVSINQKYRNFTRGLLGNFNGDKTDDFIFPNGTQLPDNSSERILYEYGKTWAVTDYSTLFVYDLPGQNTSTFTDPTFTPIFLDEVNATVRAEAEKVCDSQTNLPCIFDYIATKNVLVARSSMAASEMFTIQNMLAANQVPVCDGANGFNITVNETLRFDLKCSDADNDSLSVKIISQPLQGFSYNFNSSTGVLSVTYTPVSTANESLEIAVMDNKNATSDVYMARWTVCSGCSQHGQCNFNEGLTILSSYHSVARCDCFLGYSDLNCDKDKDGCSNNPCPESTNCTDVSAEEESQTGHAFNCSNCPSGFELVLNGTKCQDINECDDNSTQWCDINAVCVNSIGSFQCTCRQGFRLLNKRCIDINECTDNLHSCQQLCINQSPFYTCDCNEGYVSSGNNCTKVAVSDVCQNHSCEYGCRNNSGQPECFCPTGFKLAANGTACIDIDECAENLCAQGCNNTIGSYSCFCFDGFVKSPTDRHYCDVCAANRYGKDCNSTCNCRGRAERCDNVKGCVCWRSWTGVECDQDVDECSLKLDECPSDQMCTNTNGSYTCDCPTGYELRNSTCENINECNNRFISNCTQLCIDSVGSYSCQCRDGYILGDDGSCLDLDECTAKTSGCEHKCGNTPGSFNCECFPGFVLNIDRRTCRKAQDTCESVNITCQFDCTVIDTIPQCFCKAGYILGTDNSTCIDVNECKVKGNGTDENLCTDLCNNLEGSYECSCPAGKALQIDRRSCKECDSFHWGNNCSQNCGCYPMGSELCDPILGCICKPGWAGQDCKQDVNECNYQVSPCPVNTNCINIAGSFNCQCRTGYNLVNGSCEDIDECSSRSPCDHNCENTPGSYVCSCFKGFTKNGDKCEDINECTVPILNNCDQLCRNTLGGYACECFDGYNLNITTRRTCDLMSATKVCNSSSCDQLCAVNASNVEVCSCHAGYELQSNKCINIDECASKPCINGTCIDGVGNFTCTCSSGYKLGSDLKTCLECEEGYYGINCNSSCQCNSTNTDSCNTTDGTCVCKPGWQGQTCSVDIDECSTNVTCYNNSQCINSEGSYKCVCNTGYISTGSGCIACNPIHYGQDCAQTCTCNFANTLDCNHTTGLCHCKPGWTGANCELDINECSNTSYCSTDHVECINLNGSAECRCLPGYERPANSTTCQDINECLDPKLTKCSSLKTCNNTQGGFVCVCEKGFQEINGFCTACDSTHFGQNCSSICDCFVANSADCNDVDGQCLCNTGWTGPKCDRLINQCANASFCTAANEACYNISGVLSCDCATGFYKPSTGTSCQACNSTHWGQNCLNLCQCDANNSQDCNDVNGTCTCNSGWNGTHCDQDIDECAINSTFCSNPHEVCHNLKGSAECVCQDGFYKSTILFSCQACDSLHYGPNCTSVCSCHTSNTADCNDVNGTCSCKPGWTGADCSQGCDPNHYGQDCTFQCNCQLNNSAVCNTTDGHCTCLSGWTGDDCGQAVTSAQTKDLIIGLSVGIPLFVLLLIIIVIIICVCLRNRGRNTGSHTPTEDWESPFRSIFPTRLNTKESWGSPSVYSPDGFSDAASSTGSMDGQLIKSISSKNSTVQDTTWNHSEVLNKERGKGIGANFSWDYMFNILQNHRGFEIQRPIINPSPNPAFATPPREDDSHA